MTNFDKPPKRVEMINCKVKKRRKRRNIKLIHCCSSRAPKVPQHVNVDQVGSIDGKGYTLNYFPLRGEGYFQFNTHKLEIEEDWVSLCLRGTFSISPSGFEIKSMAFKNTRLAVKHSRITYTKL